MSTLRYVLSWYYWLLFVFAANLSFWVIPRVIITKSVHQPHSSYWLIGMDLFNALAALVFGFAWWTLRRRSTSDPSFGWILAAGTMNC
jgi:hypothetical protein